MSTKREKQKKPKEQIFIILLIIKEKVTSENNLKRFEMNPTENNGQVIYSKLLLRDIIDKNRSGNDE